MSNRALRPPRCSRSILKLKNYDTPIVCTCRRQTSQRVHAERRSPGPTSSRRGLLACLTIAPHWLYISGSKAAEVATSSFAEATDPYFYAQYPYARPDDILPYLQDQATPGDAQSVLDAIDAFSVYYPMYRIGPEKGSLLEQQLSEHGPIHQALELGTFLGYSAVRIARQMPPTGHLVCIDHPKP